MSSEQEIPEIFERYGEYRPPFDVKKITEELLRSVPDKYLCGLRSVLLVDSGALSRRDRVGKTWSRKRKYDKSRIAGRYNYNSGAAWIEIRVDRTISGWKGNSSGGLWIPAVRYICIAHVLYHELGHHIHRTIKPEFKGREDVADNWRIRLTVNFIRKKYWYLTPLLTIASKAYRALKRKGKQTSYSR